jgi:hypothetical protein
MNNQFTLPRWAAVAGMLLATLAVGGCATAGDQAGRPSVAPTSAAVSPSTAASVSAAEVPTGRPVRIIPISRYGSPAVDQSGREGHLAVDTTARLTFAVEPTPCCDGFQIAPSGPDLYTISTRPARNGQNASCLQVTPKAGLTVATVAPCQARNRQQQFRIHTVGTTPAGTTFTIVGDHNAYLMTDQNRDMVTDSPGMVVSRIDGPAPQEHVSFAFSRADGPG